MKRSFPVKQLDDRHYQRWEGVNIQEAGTEPPKEDENTLVLYMIDTGTESSKRFTVTLSMRELLQRKVSHVAYGTTNEKTRQQVKIVLQWEKEVRV